MSTLMSFFLNLVYSSPDGLSRRDLLNTSLSSPYRKMSEDPGKDRTYFTTPHPLSFSSVSSSSTRFYSRGSVGETLSPIRPTGTDARSSTSPPSLHSPHTTPTLSALLPYFSDSSPLYSQTPFMALSGKGPPSPTFPRSRDPRGSD